MNEVVSSLLEGLAYSLAGFLFGVLVGSRVSLRRMVSQEEVEKPGKVSGLAIVLITLALGTVIQSVYYSYRYNQATECLADYNKEYATAANQRVDWADEDREALITFFKIPRSASEAVRDAGYDELVDTYTTNNEKREATPYPDKDSCD